MALEKIKKNKKIIAFAILGLSLGVGGYFANAFIKKHHYYKDNKEEFNIMDHAKDTASLNLMSFNIRTYTPADTGKKNWPYRANLVIKNIMRTKPDIIGFQEVQKKQQEYLKESLKGYDYIIDYRDDSPHTEGCPIYYRKDKYKLIDKGSFWLSETPEVMSKDWGAACYRICSNTILEEVATGKRFVVFNTHLDHVSDEARVKGIGVVLNKIKDFGGLPAVLMGDFNATEDSETYEMAIKHFDDVKYQTENTMDSATYQNWGERLDAPCIDYILVSKGDFLVKKYFVQIDTYDGVYPSDHFPVCTELELK